jgi:hypothetical protein
MAIDWSVKKYVKKNLFVPLSSGKIVCPYENHGMCCTLWRLSSYSITA